MRRRRAARLPTASSAPQPVRSRRPSTLRFDPPHRLRARRPRRGLNTPLSSRFHVAGDLLARLLMGPPPRLNQWVPSERRCVPSFPQGGAVRRAPKQAIDGRLARRRATRPSCCHHVPADTARFESHITRNDRSMRAARQEKWFRSTARPPKPKAAFCPFGPKPSSLSIAGAARWTLYFREDAGVSQTLAGQAG